MSQYQARRMAEEVLSDNELDAISNGINGIQHQMCLRDTRRLMARKAIAAALVKFTQGQEPALYRFCVDGQYFTGATRERCQKALAGAQVEAVIEPLYPLPIPSQQEDRKPLVIAGLIGVVAIGYQSLQLVFNSLEEADAFQNTIAIKEQK